MGVKSKRRKLFGCRNTEFSGNGSIQATLNIGGPEGYDRTGLDSDRPDLKWVCPRDLRFIPILDVFHFGRCSILGGVPFWDIFRFWTIHLALNCGVPSAMRSVPFFFFPSTIV